MEFVRIEYFERFEYIEFRFSNKRRAQKFTQNYAGNRQIISLRLSSLFGFKVKLDTCADIALYLKIEDSPYLILNDGQVYNGSYEIMWDNALKKVSVNL